MTDSTYVEPTLPPNRRHEVIGAVQSLLFLVALLAASCDDHATNPDIGGIDQEIFPLAFGNYWDYYTWRVDPVLGDTFREEIVNEYLLMYEGREYRAYGYKRVPLNSGVILNDMEWLWAHSPRGLLLFGGKFQEETYLKNELYLKFPGKAGDSWSLQTVEFNIDTGKFSMAGNVPMHLLETRAPCRTETIPMDGCHVYHYEEFGEGDLIYHWFTYIYVKPGLGIVHVETLDKQRGHQNPAPRVMSRKELLDFHIAQ